MSLHDRAKPSAKELIHNCPTWLLSVSLLMTSGVADSWKHFAVSMLLAMLAEVDASGTEEGQGELWSRGYSTNDNGKQTNKISYP